MYRLYQTLWFLQKQRAKDIKDLPTMTVKGERYRQHLKMKDIEDSGEFKFYLLTGIGRFVKGSVEVEKAEWLANWYSSERWVKGSVTV